MTRLGVLHAFCDRSRDACRLHLSPPDLLASRRTPFGDGLRPATLSVSRAHAAGLTSVARGEEAQRRLWGAAGRPQRPRIGSTVHDAHEISGPGR
jgi:hypothetical protein